jgi:hypothetical protein
MTEKLPIAKRITTSKTINGAILGFEKTLFKAEDKLRKNIEATEYTDFFGILNKRWD